VEKSSVNRTTLARRYQGKTRSNAEEAEHRDCAIESKGDRCTILNISTNNEAGWIRDDIESGAEDSENHCAVLGRTEDNNAAQQYYILVAVLTGKNGEFRRVGVRIVRTGCVEKLGCDIRVV
jgi:hypothetical protein